MISSMMDVIKTQIFMVILYKLVGNNIETRVSQNKKLFIKNFKECVFVV